uniref:Ribosomal protein S7 n=1 Tax=Pseudourostyla cristata TaxID=293816 RepID=A0A4P9JLF9_9SPIT|nr:ribosomal protein S7 [Pseudourostyla cristata]
MFFNLINKFIYFNYMMIKINLRLKDFTIENIKNIDFLLQSKFFTIKDLIKNENLSKHDVRDLYNKIRTYRWLRYAIIDDESQQKIIDTLENLIDTWGEIRPQFNFTIKDQKRVESEKAGSDLAYFYNLKFLLWQNVTKQNFDTVMQHQFDELLFNRRFTSRTSDTNLFFKNDYFKLISDFETIENHNYKSLNEETNIYTTYKYFRYTSFINFFIENQISTPTNFKKIKSIRRKNNELPHLKLINIIMRNGKKEQYTKYFFTTLSLFYSNSNSILNTLNTNFKKKINFTNVANYSPTFFKNPNLEWFKIYLLFNNIFYFYDFEVQANITNKEKYSFIANYNNVLTNTEKQINSEFFIKTYLFNKFWSISPIFTYFILNVDKKIRKFSRGKSGKYKMIWKYVISYKRLNTALRMLKQAIKFAIGTKFKDRLFLTLLNLFSPLQNNILLKSKLFSHTHTFRNYKYTLMRTLKSTN